MKNKEGEERGRDEGKKEAIDSQMQNKKRT